MWCFPAWLGSGTGREAEEKLGFGINLEARVEESVGTEWSPHRCTSVDLFLFALSQPLTFQMAGKDLPYVSKC